MKIVLVIIFESTKEQIDMISVVSALLGFCQPLTVSSYDLEKLGNTVSAQGKKLSSQLALPVVVLWCGVSPLITQGHGVSSFGKKFSVSGYSLVWLFCQHQAAPFVSPHQLLVRSGHFAPKRLLSGSEQHVYLINSKITLALRQIIYSILIYSCERPKFIIMKYPQETFRI